MMCFIVSYTFAFNLFYNCYVKIALNYTEILQLTSIRGMCFLEGKYKKMQKKIEFLKINERPLYANTEYASSKCIHVFKPCSTVVMFWAFMISSYKISSKKVTKNVLYESYSKFV